MVAVEPTTSQRNWVVMGYHAREGLREDLAPGDVPRLLGDPDWELWVDITAPGEADIQFLREVLRFHPLAIEDVVQRHQRAKIDQYEGYSFLVLYAGKGDDPGRPLRELNVFASRSYLVTVHNRPLDEVASARERWKEAVAEPSIGATSTRSNAAEIGLYVLLDTVVDSYLPLLDEVGELLEEAELAVFEQNDRTRVVRDLLELRKRLLQLRRVFAPTRDVVNQLTRRELDPSGGHLTLYYLDVYDHLVRVLETADVYREMISSALDASHSVSSFRLNETMRTMTALATILMSMTLVVGIYGMNFRLMPELEWSLGYPFALTLMAVVGGLVTTWFRRKGWL